MRRSGRDEHRPAQPFLKIGPADTAPPHPELQFSGPRRRGRRHLLHPHVTPPMPPDGQHPRRLPPVARSRNLYHVAQFTRRRAPPPEPALPAGLSRRTAGREDGQDPFITNVTTLKTRSSPAHNRAARDIGP